MKFNKNDEYFTLKSDVINLLDNIHLSKDKIVWCPFDKDDSNIVIALKEYGYKVINTHLEYGQDFLNYVPNFHFDVIISNPPFSIKTKIINLIADKYKCKFILLFGLQSLSVSSFVDSLYKIFDIGFILPIKRVKFKNFDGIIKSPSFQSVWITNLFSFNLFI